MIATALFVGFFSAIGWWAGNKTTALIDDKPVVVICTPTKE